MDAAEPDLRAALFSVQLQCLAVQGFAVIVDLQLGDLRAEHPTRQEIAEDVRVNGVVQMAVVIEVGVADRALAERREIVRQSQPGKDRFRFAAGIDAVLQEQLRTLDLMGPAVCKDGRLEHLGEGFRRSRGSQVKGSVKLRARHAARLRGDGDGLAMSRQADQGDLGTDKQEYKAVALQSLVREIQRGKMLLAGLLTEAQQRGQRQRGLFADLVGGNFMGKVIGSGILQNIFLLTGNGKRRLTHSVRRRFFLKAGWYLHWRIPVNVSRETFRV